MAPLTIADLAGVVYSSGKVFDGLRTGRLDTENFLRSGNLAGVTSRSDLALLEDMRDVSQFVIDHAGRPIDAGFVRSVNAQFTRSAAIEPGRLRPADPPIGVNTRHGRHDPKALTESELQLIIDEALSDENAGENALDLFVSLAKAQPFQDGNKCTALFVANARLIAAGNNMMLTIPVDESNPLIADEFNDRLARGYIFDERDEVKDLLRRQGLTGIGVRPRLARSRHLPPVEDRAEDLELGMDDDGPQFG